MNDIHPLAWWVWGIGVAIAAMGTTNAVLLVALIAAVCFVVSSGPSRGFRVYLFLAAAVVAVRLVARMVFGVEGSGTVLFTLPSWQPFGPNGLRFGGAVTGDALRAALGDGCRLAALLVAIGAANAIADPKRLLRSLPSAWGHVGTALMVAVNVTPQLADSVRRVTAARSLRGEGRRRLVRDLVTPVMVDALDRSIALAAAMESRGYGRGRDADRAARIGGAIGVLGGLSILTAGTFVALTRTGGLRDAGVFAQVIGAVAALGGTVAGARRSTVTRYRPDRFGPRSVFVAATGIGAAVRMTVAVGDAVAHPLGWAMLSPSALAVVVCTAAAAAVRS